MAVPEGPTEKRYGANGVTTSFTIPFLLLEAGDLKVYLNDIEVTSGFSITGVGLPQSTIIFTVAPSGILLLQLDVPFNRLNDYQENGDFLSSTVNRDFDRIWQAMKQLLRYSTRALTLGFFDIDGNGFYRAKGNGIINLASANGVDNAATNWKDVRELVAEVLETGQGSVNTAANVLYVAPDGSIKNVQQMSGSGGAAMLGYGAGTVADILQHVFVSPFIMNDSGVTARIANRFALIAYLSSGEKVEVPAGDLWISSGIELPSGCNIEGAGRDITKIFGDGNLFTISTAPGLQIRVANMSVANDVTRGDLFSNTSSTDSQGQLFENIHFGKSTCHFRSTAPNLVHPRFKKCRFVDASSYSRIFNGLWVYEEEACYTWYNGGGVAHASGQSNTCSVVGSVYEYNRGGAFDLASTNGFALGWTFTGVHFEGNGTADLGSPDVLLRTSSPQRIRSIVFIGCGFYEPRVSQPARVLLDAGGGGNIQGVKETLKKTSKSGEIRLSHELNG